MGAMTVEGIIAETLDLAAMRLQWTEERPRLRQGMRMPAYQPLRNAYRDLRTLDQAYYAPDEPAPDVPAAPPTEVPEEPPSPEAEESLSPTSAPPDAELTSDEEADLEQRQLNLRGLGSEKGGFDLLASPFSGDNAEDNNED
jgi:hypothetical protein